MTENHHEHQTGGGSAEAGLLSAAVRQLSGDMHNRSARPCHTCAAVTRALGEPFGCDAFRASLRRTADNAKDQP